MKYDDDDLPPLARIAKEAGRIVRDKREDIIANQRVTYKKDESGKEDCTQPVTVVDRMSDLLIARMLKEYEEYKNIPILSEENSSGMNEKALKANERFEVDSLDNTSSYIHPERYDGYSVNIAHVKDGVPIAGAAYFPAKEELYFTSKDGKTAFVQRGDEAPERISAKGLPLRQPLKVAVGWHMDELPPLEPDSFVTAKRPGQYRALLTADSRSGIDLTQIDRGFKTWDIAATHAILKAAGAEIIGEDGLPKRYGASEDAGFTLAGGVETLKALNLMDKGIKMQRELR